MKHDLTTGTWRDDTGCPISIILATTSDARREVLRTDRGGQRDTVPVIVCVQHDLRPQPDGLRGVRFS